MKYITLIIILGLLLLQSSVSSANRLENGRIYSLDTTQVSPYILQFKEFRLVYVFGSWSPASRQELPFIRHFAHQKDGYQIIALATEKGDARSLNYILQQLTPLGFPVINVKGRELKKNLLDAGIQYPDAIPYVAFLAPDDTVLFQGSYKAETLGAIAKKHMKKWLNIQEEKKQAAFRKEQEKAEVYYKQAIRIAPTNREEAKKLLQKGVDLDHLKSKEQLGFMLLTDGIKQKNNAYITQALSLLAGLAQVGNPSGQAYLGSMYEGGYGVVQDDQLAFDWYLKAAKQMHAQAQFSVAKMYFEGRGINKDPEEGMYWLKSAIDHDYEDAEDYLEEMNSAKEEKKEDKDN